MSRAIEDPEFGILTPEVLKTGCARHGVKICVSMNNVSKGRDDFEEDDSKEECYAIETFDCREGAIQ